MKNKKSICHLFRGDMTFHVIPMIKNILNTSNHSHYFIICIIEKKHEKVYVDFFKSIAYNKYAIVFFYNGRNGIGDALKRIKADLLFMCQLIKHHRDPIIAHGGFYPSPLHILISINILKSVSIVEWYSIPNPDDKHFYNQIYIHGLKKMRYVICLLNDERDIFNKMLNRKDVIILPYITSKNNPHEIAVKSGNKILVGNRDMEYYSDVVDKLSRLSDVEIRFMCNYFKRDSDKYNQFKQYATNKLGKKNKLIFWEGVVPIDEYNKIVQNYDIYICASPTQSGLGAIYFCLQNGIKLYLTGRNLSWLKYNNFIVYSLDEINQAMNKTELFDYSEDDMNYNKTHFESVLSRDSIAERWNQLYTDLLIYKHK